MAAHILHKNLLSLPSASKVTDWSFDSGWEVENCLNVGTALKSKIAANTQGGFEYDLGAAYVFSSVAIARHNFNSTGAKIRVYSSSTSGGPWNASIDFTPTSDDVFLQNFTSVSARYVRVEISGQIAPVIFSVLYIGDALKLPRPMPNGFTPPEFGRQDEVKASFTAGNEIAGISVIRKPTKTRVMIKQAPATWFFEYWIGLTESLLSRPVFFRWKETGSTIYGYVPKRLQPPKFKKNHYMDGNIDIEGFVS